MFLHLKCWGWVVLSNPAVELGALLKPCQRTIFTLLGQWRQAGAKAELCATVTFLFIFLLIYLTEQILAAWYYHGDAPALKGEQPQSC